MKARALSRRGRLRAMLANLKKLGALKAVDDSLPKAYSKPISAPGTGGTWTLFPRASWTRCLPASSPYPNRQSEQPLALHLALYMSNLEEMHP